MAIHSANGCKLQVERVQSVVPTNPTDPRKSFKIIVSRDLSSTSILQRRFQILLCYNKDSEDDDSGWLMAGRIKESLGTALQEQPLLAGRLRHCEENRGDLEIVSNDSGVRLVEATTDMKLMDFLELKEKNSEAELVFWEDVLEHNPQFSPLFYVQVTNFTCGGYSIGISCSLLLMDPFVLTTFLKKWANIHDTMFPRTDDHMPKIPTFYLPNLARKPAGSSPALLIGSNTHKNAAECVIFKLPSKIPTSDNNNHENLAALCINEAERDFSRKLASNLSLIVKVPSGDTKVEIYSRKELLESRPSSNNIINGLSCARTWDELGLDSIRFHEWKKPAYVSCWINSVADHEGSVMIIPLSDADTSEVRIVVTFN